jgi:hypothetical protein
LAVGHRQSYGSHEPEPYKLHWQDSSYPALPEFQFQMLKLNDNVPFRTF